MIYQNLCPHCGALRSEDFHNECLACGSKLIPVFGYRYPHEIRSLRYATIILIVAVIFTIIFGILYILIPL